MNVKKYKLKYDYLKLELEDTQDRLKEYTLEWNSRFGKYFEGLPSKQEVWVNEETGEIYVEAGDELADAHRKTLAETLLEPGGV